MGIGKNILQGKRRLFGKNESNDIPANMDIIQFNSTSQEWELISGVVGNAVQSSSNVGTGDGLALPRVLDDLPFKTLVDNLEIIITVSATELAFSIGAIAISKITGLQIALDTKIETITNVGGASEIAQAKIGQNVSLRTLLANLEILITTNANDLAFSIGAIAQSKITGLVASLATKIDTVVNVGAGVGLIFRDIVGTTINLKSLIAGSGITITNNANDITITQTTVSRDIKSGNDSVAVNGTTTVTFNTAFAGVPNVTAQLMDDVDHLDGEKGAVLSIYSVTVNGFTIRYDAPDTLETPVDFDWIATDGGNP